MILILMGVAGSGKTTVGRALAARIGAPFFDADDFHSEPNRSKMARGTPLSEADRVDWIQQIFDSLLKWDHDYPLSVFACSALKRDYREKFQKGTNVFWIYLKGNQELIAARLAQRKNHFFDPALLASQTKDFEEPLNAWTVDVSADVDTIVAGLIGHLKETHVLRR